MAENKRTSIIIFSVLTVILFAIFIILLVMDGRTPSFHQHTPVDFILFDNMAYDKICIEIIINAIHKFCTAPIYSIRVLQSVCGVYENVNKHADVRIEPITSSMMSESDAFLRLLPGADNVSQHFVWLGNSTCPVKKFNLDVFWTGGRKARFFGLPLDNTLIRTDRLYTQSIPVSMIKYDITARNDSISYAHFMNIYVHGDVIFSPRMCHVILLTEEISHANILLETESITSEVFFKILLSCDMVDYDAVHVLKAQKFLDLIV